MTSVVSLERCAMECGEANHDELRIRAYRQIGGSNIICDYTIKGVSANRGDAISYISTGKTLRERQIA
jgi:hypothetical protein